MHFTALVLLSLLAASPLPATPPPAPESATKPADDAPSTFPAATTPPEQPAPTTTPPPPSRPPTSHAPRQTLEPIEVTEATGTTRSPAENTPAFVAVIPLEESPSAAMTLGDHLAPVPGLQVNRLGGAGGYATLLVRGASSGQLMVLLDGVPLTHPSQGDVNLSDLPLDALERIEVYRGYSPLAFGADAIAGVLNLVSRAPTRPLEVRIRTGLGSFGERRASAALGVRRSRWDGQLTIGARAGDGDFPFYFDNGTLYNPSDDRIERRQNNDWQALEATARSRYRTPAGLSLVLHATGFTREQGIAAPGSAQPIEAARYATRRGNAYARLETPPGLFHLSTLLDVALGEERLTDPLGEVSLAPTETRDRSLSAGLTTHGSILLGTNHLIELVVVARDDRYRPEGDSSAPAEQARTRLGLGGQYELRTRSLAVIPGLLYDFLRPRSSGDGTLEAPAPSNLLSPRLGLEWTPLPDRLPWRIRANGGRFHRSPTFYELYGARGFLVGNPELEPETGLNLDLGTSIRLRPGVGRRSPTGARAAEGTPVTESSSAMDESALTEGPLFQLEVAGFWNQVENLIYYEPNSQRTVRPRNLASARMMGIEAGGGFSWGPLNQLTAGYTLLFAENRSEIPSQQGKQLPGRPRHALHLTATAGTARVTGLELGGFYRIDAASGGYLDPSNTRPVPPRVLHDLGITARLTRTTLRGLEATAEVKNLFDLYSQEVDYSEAPQMVQDFIGYPLPGRAFYLTVGWKR